MTAVEGQRSYYEGALVARRFVEARRPTKRRFGPQADATWAAFRGELGASARIDARSRSAYDAANQPPRHARPEVEDR